METKHEPTGKVRERLTRERVIDAALQVMDSEGLDAVSMRRVAREVGVEAMSLYNHVHDKEDLLAGIQQRVFSEFSFEAVPGDPFGNGARVAHAWRDLMRAHPALIEIMAEKHQAPISVEALRPMEKALQVLRAMGVPDPEVMQVFHAFGGYIQGFVMMESQLAFADRDPTHFHEVLDQLSSQDLPCVAAAMPYMADCDLDQQFDFGLDLMLQGLKSRFSPGS
jgi:TetR/AcrR family tetracycline transcriptional repressor